MNSKENLNHIRVSFWDLIGFSKKDCEWTQFSRHSFNPFAVKRVYDHVPGVYNQSSISDLVDEYFHVRTAGRCYNKPSFEIKLKSHDQG